MELLQSFMDYVVHIDRHLNLVVQSYGSWTYLILFSIVFCETGLVIAPFLPGDSLLFATGAFVAKGSLELEVVLPVLLVAAVLGDTLNYWIGYYVGPKVFRKKNARFLNKEYLDRAHAFYQKHGGKTVAMARFFPFVRTFAPFVAGVGRMHYWHFVLYSIFGTCVWIGVFVSAGYALGNIPFIEEKITVVTMVAILIPLILGLIGFLYQKYKAFLGSRLVFITALKRRLVKRLGK